MNKENKELYSKLYYESEITKYPSFKGKEHLLPPPKFNDTTANGLTKTIIKFIQMIGGQAERVSSMGRMIDNRKVSTDVLGRQRTIGTMKYIPGTSTNGTADISAIYKGISFKIEVKIGADRQSEAQKKYQKDVERAGAVYIIAKDFDNFIIDFKNEIINRK